MRQQQSGLAEDLDEIVSKKGEYIKVAAEKIAEADFCKFENDTAYM